MTAPHRTTFSFDYVDADRARLVERAIRQEVDEIADDRSWTTVTRNGATLQVVVAAEDLVALRAGMNTWLTLTDVAERSAER